MSDNKGSRPAAYVAWPLILGAALLSWWLFQPPSPLCADAPENEFSAARAMKHIEVIAREVHPASSAANDEVYEYIQEQVQALGLEMALIEEPKHDGNNHVEWRRAALGRIRGTAPTRAFAVDAHFDSTPYGPGAGDIITGIAAMLETARILKLEAPLKNDVIFAFTDQEEVGANGARAFTEHPWFGDVGVMLGLEARGVRGPSLMFETSDQNGWLIRELKRSGVPARANSIMFSVYDQLPFGSDFGLYKHYVPGYNVAFVDGFEYYHTRLDRPDKVSLASIQHHGEYTLGLARHLGNIPLTDCRAPNATYFNPLGSWLVVYPNRWDSFFSLTALLLLGTALAVGLRRGVLRVTGLLGAVAAMTLGLAIALAGAAPALVALLLYREAALYMNTLYCVSMAGLAVAVGLLLFGPDKRRPRATELLAASLLFWALLLYPLQRYLAGGLHIAVWPIHFGAAMLLALVLGPDATESPAPKKMGALTVWMLPVVTFLTPLLVMTAHTMTPLSAFLVNPLIVIFLGLLAPQVRLLGGRLSARLAAVAAIASVLLFGWALAVGNRPGPDTPKLNAISYAANFDTGEAWWVSPDRTPREWVRDSTGRELPAGWFAKESPIDSWTEQFFPDGVTRGAITEFRLGDQREYLKAPAPVPNFEPFNMDMVEDELVNGRRRVSMHLHSPRMAGRIWLEKTFSGPVYAATIEGMDLEPSDGDWRAFFHFLPAGGARLELEVDPDQPLTFFAREESWSYPRFEGYTERPEHMAAEPNRVLDFHSRLHSEHCYTLATIEARASGYDSSVE